MARFGLCVFGGGGLHSFARRHARTRVHAYTLPKKARTHVFVLMYVWQLQSIPTGLWWQRRWCCATTVGAKGSGGSQCCVPAAIARCSSPQRQQQGICRLGHRLAFSIANWTGVHLFVCECVCEFKEGLMNCSVTEFLNSLSLFPHTHTHTHTHSLSVILISFLQQNGASLSQYTRYVPSYVREGSHTRAKDVRFCLHLFFSLP